MSLQLLQRIEAAEAKAEQMRQEAQRQARDMQKSAEDAFTAQEREAQLSHRTFMRRALEEAQAETASHLEKELTDYAAAREKMITAADAKLGDAVQFIYERIVKNGNR